MNTASPASSQPIGLRGWWPATTRPTAAIATTIVSKLSAAHSWPDTSELVATPDITRKTTSPAITVTIATVTTRTVRRERSGTALLLPGAAGPSESPSPVAAPPQAAPNS